MQRAAGELNLPVRHARFDQDTITVPTINGSAVCSNVLQADLDGHLVSFLDLIQPYKRCIAFQHALTFQQVETQLLCADV